MFSWTLLAYKTTAFGSSKPPKPKPLCTSVWLWMSCPAIPAQRAAMILMMGEYRPKFHFFPWVMIILHLRERQSWLAQAGTAVAESLMLCPLGFWGRRRDDNVKNLYNHWKQPFLSTYPCFPWAWGCKGIKGRGSDSEAWMSHAFIPEILQFQNVPWLYSRNSALSCGAGQGRMRFGENSRFFLWIIQPLTEQSLSRTLKRAWFVAGYMMGNCLIARIV